MRNVVPTNIEEYIAASPATVRSILRQIRRVMRAAAPEAEEVISYRMPAFKQRGILSTSRRSRITSACFRQCAATRSLRKPLRHTPGPKAI